MKKVKSAEDFSNIKENDEFLNPEGKLELCYKAFEGKVFTKEQYLNGQFYNIFCFVNCDENGNLVNFKHENK